MSKSGNCTICGNFIPDLSKAKNGGGILDLVFGSTFPVCGARCLKEYKKAHPTRTSKWWIIPLLIFVAYIALRNDDVTDTPDVAQTPIEMVNASSAQGPQPPIVEPSTVPKAITTDDAPNVAGMQNWTNSEGKTISAKFEGVTMELIVFRLPDGTRSEYPMKKLSAESQSLALQMVGLRETRIVGFGKVVNVDEGDTLNVRTTPSSAAQIIGKLRSNMDAIPIIGEAKMHVGESWLPILITSGNGLATGWVNAIYLAP
jgi:hypothetical protein